LADNVARGFKFLSGGEELEEVGARGDQLGVALELHRLVDGKLAPPQALDADLQDTGEPAEERELGLGPGAWLTVQSGDAEPETAPTVGKRSSEQGSHLERVAHPEFQRRFGPVIQVCDGIGAFGPRPFRHRSVLFAVHGRTGGPPLFRGEGAGGSTAKLRRSRGV
jgi:hypothetical protein